MSLISKALAPDSIFGRDRASSIAGVARPELSAKQEPIEEYYLFV